MALCMRSYRLRAALFAVSSLALVDNTLATQGSSNSSIVATRISTDNIAQLQRQGPDAIGGIGDWFISNGTLCGVISSVEHESEFSKTGGSLIDLGFCGRADDHFNSTQDLLNGSRRRPLNAVSVDIEEYQDQPSIVVHAKGDGARATTRYYFDINQPTQLKIDKRYETHQGQSGVDADTKENKFSFISPLQFNYHSLEPFVFNSRDPQTSNGFQNEDFVQRGADAIRTAARNADTIITLSPRSAEHSIAYGWQLQRAQRIEGNKRFDVPFFALADTDGTAMMLLVDTFYLGSGNSIGWLQLPQISLLELDQDAALETSEIIYVSKQGDVAGITDQLLTNAPTIAGRIDDANSAIHVQQDNGAPLTHIVPNHQGQFQFRAPAGDYSLLALGHGNRSQQFSFTVKPNTDEQLNDITLPAISKLSLPQGHAMRLVFKGVDGTPDPDFASSLSQSSVTFDDHVVTPKPVSSLFMAGVTSGTNSDLKSITIAPGSYRVYATKGPEFSLEKTTITIAAGESKQLEIKPPKRVLQTINFISSDLHVHSGLSFDNAFLESERVRSFVAEHGEVMVASEHDLPTDYAPYIKAMGVSDKVVSIAAAEMTSLLPTANLPYTGGHANIFPVTPKPDEYRNGMLAHEDLRLRDFIHATKQHRHDTLIQLNHPRADLKLTGPDLPKNWQNNIDNGNYLDHMGSAAHPYNPHQGLHTHPNKTLIEPHPETGVRDLDIDLIEVINPGGPEHNERIQAVRQDWLSFLKQGERIVATANSDSHTALQPVALPRTMVAMNDDRLSHFDLAEFLRNLKAGNAYGTTGPMINISLLNATMGDTFSGLRGPLKVNIKKAPWVDLQRLEVQINGHTVETQMLSNQDKQQYIVPLEFDKDSFVTIEVFGQASEDYHAIYPDIHPYAFSNPIYVDYDQDGQWQAPGL